MAVTTDLPALRKVTQFLGHKADLGCSRCKFSAEREKGARGARGRMSYYTSSRCTDRTHDEVVLQAQEYREAETKLRAAEIAQKNGVRYSELMRLEYFDIVRMSATDPMHTFLLGLVKRETELNLRLLSDSGREEFIRRVKSIRVPYDAGRLPTNVFDSGETVSSGITAAQWKIFIVTYARSCFYNLLPTDNYKCLVLLSEIVTLVCSPVFDDEMIAKLYRLLWDHHELFCTVYDKWHLTVNYHMCLHIPDTILDLGPPQSFWCFAYERFNGILAGTPNNNRNVEMEFTNRFLQDTMFANADISAISQTEIPSPLREFISEDDGDGHLPYSGTYWVLSLLNGPRDKRMEAQLNVDRGDVEQWPLELKHPKKAGVKVSPSLLDELKCFFKELYGTEFQYVKPRIDKYGRCRVNGQNFSSDFNSTDRGSLVKTLYVMDNNDLEPYFGIVKFYFTVNVVVKNERITHPLAYVTWLKLKTSKPDPLAKLYSVTTKQTYKRDRLLSPRRFLCRCVLVTPDATKPHLSLVSELCR